MEPGQVMNPKEAAAQLAVYQELATFRRNRERSVDFGMQVAMDTVARCLMLLHSEELAVTTKPVVKALLTEMKRFAQPAQMVLLEGIEDALKFYGLDDLIAEGK